MTNWQACKYPTMIALQNDAAKNRLWRSGAVTTPRSGSYVTTQNRGKPPPPPPPFKRPQEHNRYDSHGNFENNDSKCAFSNKGQWGQPKDAKACFKSPSKLYIPDINVDRERRTYGSKIYNSCNTAKNRLVTEEFKKRC